MAGLGEILDYLFVYDDNFIEANVSVGSTQVEAKVGASALVKRELVRVYNLGPNTVYFGPSGVSTNSEPLAKGQGVSIALGGSKALFLICASGQTASVNVKEFN